MDDGECASPAATERLLKTLADNRAVTLIITVRGIALPPGLRWSNPKTAALHTLTAEAARRVFVEIANPSDDYDEAESAAADELLQEVSYMPLAVALLGQLGNKAACRRICSSGGRMVQESLHSDC